MEDYTIKAQIHRDASISLEVFRATSEKLGKEVLIKCYSLQSLATTDLLLKSAIRKTRDQNPGNFDLISLDIESATAGLKVNFIYEKLSKELDDSLVKTNDALQGCPSGLDGYTLGEVIYSREDFNGSNVCVFAARSAQQREVVVKTYPRREWIDANILIKEAFVQARVDHPYNCELIDAAITPRPDGKPGFVISLIMERLKSDVLSEIETRKKESRPFTERELLVFLQQVSEGLAYAKSKRVAHCDVKPQNIFLGANGSYKVGDFGSAWEKTKHSLDDLGRGTLVYLSPEARRVMLAESKHFRPFVSDVYSLGVTLLHLATLTAPMQIAKKDVTEAAIQTEVGALQVSDQLKTVMLKMIKPNAKKRVTLEVVHGIVSEMLASDAAPAATSQKSEGGYSAVRGTLKIEQLVESEKRNKAAIRGLKSAGERSSAKSVSLRFVSLHYDLCLIFHDQGKLKPAEKYARKTISLKAICPSPGEPEYYTIFNALSTILLAQGRLEDAEETAYRAVLQLARWHACDSPFFGPFYNNLAIIFLEQKRFPQAEHCARTGIRLTSKFLGASHPSLVATYNTLALILKSQGRFSESDRVFQTSLSAQKGTNDLPKLASTYANLAETYMNQERFSEAEGFALQSISIQQRCFTANNPLASATYSVLSRVCRGQGKLQDAEKYGQMSLSSLLFNNADGFKLATAYGRLAEIYLETGQMREAEQHALKSLALHEKLLSATHPDLALTYEILTLVYTGLEKPIEVESYAKKCIGIRQQILSPGDPLLDSMLERLCRLYQDLGRYTEAETIAVKMLNAQVRSLGENHPEVGRKMQRLVMVLLSLGKHRETEELLQRMLKNAETNRDKQRIDLCGAFIKAFRMDKRALLRLLQRLEALPA